MNQNSTREIGTLKNFRERIMRYNVPTTVKNNPGAYEEFFVSVGRAYLVEAFLEFFGMENTKSEPLQKICLNKMQAWRQRRNTLIKCLGSLLTTMFSTWV